MAKTTKVKVVKRTASQDPLKGRKATKSKINKGTFDYADHPRYYFKNGGSGRVLRKPLDQ